MIVPLISAATPAPSTINPPATGEILVRSVQAQSLNSGDVATTQDFTVTGFGAPTAWIVTICEASTTDTIEGDAGLSVGFSDGATERYVFFGAEKDETANYASSDTGSGSVGVMLTPGGTAVILDVTSATTTNGITLTYNTKPTDRKIVTVDLISCEDARVDSFSGGSGSEVWTTGSIFEPQFVFTVHANGIGSPTNGWRGSIGFAAQDLVGTITQGAWSQRFRTSANTPVNIGHIARDGSFTTTLSSTFVESRYTLTSFNADGFSYTLTGTGYSVFYLALQASKSNFWVGWTQTRTTAPSVQDVDVGFQSGGGFITSTFLSVLDAVETTLNGPCSSGFHSWNGQEQHSSSVSLEDGSPLGSSTGAEAFSRASSTLGLDVLDEMGALAISASVECDCRGVTQGFTVTYATTDATARYFLAAAWEPIQVTKLLDEEVVQVVDGLIPSRGRHKTMDTEVVQVVDENLISVVADAPTVAEGMLSQLTYPSSERSVLAYPGSEASNLRKT